MWPNNKNSGFTLIEIMVVVIITGILISLAIPGASKLILTTRNNIIVNDLKVFAGAFHQYAGEKGMFPDDQGSGESFPPGMDTYLAQTAWTRKTPIGGNYNWDRNANHGGTVYEAVISIADSPENDIIVTMEQLGQIDSQIDDGDLNTGLFRLGRRNNPIFIVSN